MNNQNNDEIAKQCWAAGTKALDKQNWEYAINQFGLAARLKPDMVLYRQVLRGAQRKLYGENGKGAAMAGMKLAGTKTSLKKLLMQEKWVDVDKTAEEGLKVNPWDAMLNAAVGQAAHERGFLEVAEFAYGEAIKVEPNEVAYLREMALVLEARMEFLKAGQYWERIYKLEPNNSEARQKITDMHARYTTHKGRYEDADSTRDVKRKPGRTGYDDYIDSKKEEQIDGPGMSVEADLERAIRKEPQNVSHYLKLAAHYEKQKQLQQAFDIYSKAVEVSGGDHTIREKKEDVELALLRENLDLARGQAARQSGDETLRQQVAGLNREYGLREIEVLSRRIERYPQDMKLKYDLAKRYLQMGAENVRKAIPLLQQAVNDPRVKAYAHLLLGKCFISEKRYPLSINQYKEAIKLLNPQDNPDELCEGLYWLARLHEETNQPGEAINFYNQVLGVRYDYKDALDRLERLQGA